MDILVNVVNQKLKISTNLKNLVAGTQEFVRFVFNLTSEWDDLLIFAQFCQGGVAYNQYLGNDNSAYLPAEIGVGTCTLMLYGSNDRTIGTTNYITLTVDENILVSDANSTEISESLYNQLVTKFNDLTSWSERNVLDLIEIDKNLQEQINDKASQSEIDNLAERISQLDDISASIDNAVKVEMEKYLNSGALTNLTIEDGSVARTKVDSDFEETLKKADSAMQPDIYDPQGFKTDIFSYSKKLADEVSWDTLKNKPFGSAAYESEGNFATLPTATFDALGATWWKVSDLTPSKEQALSAVFTFNNDAITYEETPDNSNISLENDDILGISFTEGSGTTYVICYSAGDLSVDYDGTQIAFTVPESGTYVSYSIDSIPPETWNIGIYYEVVQKIDTKYLPENQTGGVYVGTEEPEDAEIGALWYDTDEESENNELPTVTAEDNGKIVQVVNGKWQLATMPDTYNKTEIDAIMGAYIADIDTLIGGDS